MLSPERNKALIGRWLEEVFTRGDLDAADGLFTPNYLCTTLAFSRTCMAPKHQAVRLCLP